MAKSQEIFSQLDALDQSMHRILSSCMDNIKTSRAEMEDLAAFLKQPVPEAGPDYVRPEFPEESIDEKLGIFTSIMFKAFEGTGWKNIPKNRGGLGRMTKAASLEEWKARFQKKWSTYTLEKWFREINTDGSGYLSMGQLEEVIYSLFEVDLILEMVMSWPPIEGIVGTVSNVVKFNNSVCLFGAEGAGKSALLACVDGGKTYTGKMPRNHRKPDTWETDLYHFVASEYQGIQVVEGSQDLRSFLMSNNSDNLSTFSFEGLVLVVDSCFGEEALDEQGLVYSKLYKYCIKNDIPLVIFLNKQDLRDAKEEKRLLSALGVVQTGRNVKIVLGSAITQEGVDAALSWLQKEVMKVRQRRADAKATLQAESIEVVQASKAIFLELLDEDGDGRISLRDFEHFFRQFGAPLLVFLLYLEGLSLCGTGWWQSEPQASEASHNMRGLIMHMEELPLWSAIRLLLQFDLLHHPVDLQPLMEFFKMIGNAGEVEDIQRFNDACAGLKWGSLLLMFLHFGILLSTEWRSLNDREKLQVIAILGLPGQPGKPGSGTDPSKDLNFTNVRTQLTEFVHWLCDVIVDIGGVDLLKNEKTFSTCASALMYQGDVEKVGKLLNKDVCHLVAVPILESFRREELSITSTCLGVSLQGGNLAVAEMVAQRLMQDSIVALTGMLLIELEAEDRISTSTNSTQYPTHTKPARSLQSLTEDLSLKYKEFEFQDNVALDQKEESVPRVGQEPEATDPALSPSALQIKNRIRILVLGLQGAGKTTVVNRLRRGCRDTVEIMMATGTGTRGRPRFRAVRKFKQFRSEDSNIALSGPVSVGDEDTHLLYEGTHSALQLRLSLRELHGDISSCLRWRDHLPDADAIIFVVESPAGSWDKAAQAFRELLNCPEMTDAPKPVAVLLNCKESAGRRRPGDYHHDSESLKKLRSTFTVEGSGDDSTTLHDWLECSATSSDPGLLAGISAGIEGIRAKLLKMGKLQTARQWKEEVLTQAVTRLVDHRRDEAILEAAMQGRVEVLKFLVKVCGSEMLHKTTADGHTPAMLAAFRGHKQALAALHEMGAPKFSWWPSAKPFRQHFTHTIWIQGCELSVVPEGLNGLPHLEVLGLPDNEISSLPHDLFEGMHKLVTLDVSNNRLTWLPTWDLCSLPKLQYLCCTGNLNIVSPPPEIFNEGPGQTMAYLRKARAEGRENREIQLITIGKGESGKTSTINALMSENNRSQKIHEDARTVGISLREWRPKDSDDLVFTIQDLAGQAVYALTNQFFLVSRAIYLLVWRAVSSKTQKTDQKMEELQSLVVHWLESLQMKVPGATVLLVVTHMDAVSRAELDLQTLWAKQLVQQKLAEFARQADGKRPVLRVYRDGDSHRINCLDGTGILQLKEDLVNMAHNLAWWKELIPGSYLRLKENIVGYRKHGKAWIDWVEYVQLAADAGVKQDLDLQLATLFLHNSGVLKHFGDCKGLCKSVKDLGERFKQGLFSSFVQKYETGGMLQEKQASEALQELGLSAGKVRIKLLDKHQHAGGISAEKWKRLTQDVSVDISVLDFDLLGLDNLEQSVFIDPHWVIDVLKGLIRHDRDALLHFFSNWAGEEQRLWLRRIRRLASYGVMHEDMKPLIWPMGSSHVSQEFWGWAKKQDEGDLWSSNVANQDSDYSQVLTLLSGFDIIHPKGEKELVAPSLLGSIALNPNIDARALSDKDCPFGRDIVFWGLPAGFFDRLVVKIRREYAACDFTSTTAAFYGMGQKAQIFQYQGRQPPSRGVFLEVNQGPDGNGPFVDLSPKVGRGDLRVQPGSEIVFRKQPKQPWRLKDQKLDASLTLTNMGKDRGLAGMDGMIAFRINATAEKRYTISPAEGIIEVGKTVKIKVQCLMGIPSSEGDEDEFLLRWCAVPHEKGLSIKNTTLGENMHAVLGVDKKSISEHKVGTKFDDPALTTTDSGSSPTQHGTSPTKRTNTGQEERMVFEKQSLRISPSLEVEVGVRDAARNGTGTITLENLESVQGGSKVVFKIKTTTPEKFVVLPTSGVLDPGKRIDVQIFLHPSFPSLAASKPGQSVQGDKFLILWGVVPKQNEGRIDSTDRNQMVTELTDPSLRAQHKLSCRLTEVDKTPIPIEQSPAAYEPEVFQGNPEEESRPMDVEGPPGKSHGVDYVVFEKESLRINPRSEVSIVTPKGGRSGTGGLKLDNLGQVLGGRTVAFRVTTSSPKQFMVKPNAGLIRPGHSEELSVLMFQSKELKEPPHRDTFLVQWGVVSKQNEGRAEGTDPRLLIPELTDPSLRGEHTLVCRPIQKAEAPDSSDPSIAGTPESLAEAAPLEKDSPVRGIGVAETVPVTLSIRTSRRSQLETFDQNIRQLLKFFPGMIALDDTTLPNTGIKEPIDVRILESEDKQSLESFLDSHGLSHCLESLRSIGVCDMQTLTNAEYRDLPHVQESGVHPPSSSQSAQREGRYHWTMLSWWDLPSHCRKHCSVLGWNEGSWATGDVRHFFKKPWHGLTQQEQNAAQKLGYSHQLWMARKHPEQLPPRHEKWMEFRWEDIPLEYLSCWTTLGWSKNRWESPAGIDPKGLWASLAQEQHEAAIAVGFDEEMWNRCEAPIHLPPGLVSVQHLKSSLGLWCNDLSYKDHTHLYDILQDFKKAHQRLAPGLQSAIREFSAQRSISGLRVDSSDRFEGDQPYRVILVCLTDWFTSDLKALSEFRHHIEKKRPIIPIIAPSYTIKNLNRWWPEEMPELENHALFFDWRKSPAVDWAKHFLGMFQSHFQMTELTDSDLQHQRLRSLAYRQLLRQVHTLMQDSSQKHAQSLWNMTRTRHDPVVEFVKLIQRLEERFTGLTKGLMSVKGDVPLMTDLDKIASSELSVSHEKLLLDLKNIDETMRGHAVVVLEDWLRKVERMGRVWQRRVEQQLVSSIVTYLQEWRGEVSEVLQNPRELIPCPICLIEGQAQPHMFRMSECQAMLHEWEVAESCRRALDDNVLELVSKDRDCDESHNGATQKTSESDVTLTQLTACCTFGHSPPLSEILSRSVIYDAIPCPQCVANNEVPPFCFNRNKCLLYFSEENIARKGLVECEACRISGRPAAIRILDIITPEVFISYQWGLLDKQTHRHRTQEFVKGLRTRIEETADVVSWLDVAGGMGAGQNLKAEMLTGIRNSTVVLIFLSDTYVNSQNCKREFLHAVRHSKFLVPVLAPDLGTVQGLSSGWGGPAPKEDPKWWEYTQTVCQESKDPDTGETIDWSILARFEPVDMRSPAQQVAESSAELEIVRKICARFHRQGHVDHSSTLKYSRWKTHQEALKLFQTLKGIDLNSETGVHMVRDFFEAMDKDSNGFVSKEELLEEFQKYGIQVMEQEADALIQDADSNHDGQIDMDEFRSLLTNVLGSHTL